MTPLRLDHRRWYRNGNTPGTTLDRRQWAAEKLIATFCDDGDDEWLDIVRILCNDSTAAETMEYVEMLGRLSAECDRLASIPGEHARDDYERVCEEYAQTLADMVGHNLTAVADAVSEPRDELAARRAR